MFLSIFIFIVAIFISAFSLFITELYKIWWADLIGIILIPIIYLLVFGIILLILFFVGLVIKPKKEVTKPNKICYWFTYEVNYILCMLTCSIKIKGLDKVPTKSRFLLIYNHRSNWDPMVLMKIFRHNDIYYITKPSNFNIPIAGPMMQKGGFLSIDRENNKNALKTILKAINIISTDKGSIGIAPEGTRNKKLETPLLPFHPGSFKIAIKSQCPIVIALIKNCENIHKNFPFKRTKVEIEILDVKYFVDYKEQTSVELSNEIYNLMLNSLDK